MGFLLAKSPMQREIHIQLYQNNFLQLWGQSSGTEHAKWPLRDTETLQGDYQRCQTVSLFCSSQNFPLRHLTLYHRKRSLNDDYFHFSCARESNWRKKIQNKTKHCPGNLPVGFLMEKHSTCKNQNIWWECVDFNVFLMGFSCKCAQFLSDVLPAWLSVVQAQQLSTWWPSRACRVCGDPAAPGLLIHRGTKHIAAPWSCWAQHTELSCSAPDTARNAEENLAQQTLQQSGVLMLMVQEITSLIAISSSQ